MARTGSPVLEWLRRNGRYLTPAGSRDMGIAVVTYLRAWLAIHTEFMFACMLLGLLVVVPHLWQHSLQVLDPKGWERWRSPWWAVSVAFWSATAPGLIAGYWAARDARDATATTVSPSWRDVLFLLAAALGAYLLLRALQPNGALALTSLVAGQLAVMGWIVFNQAPHALKVARLRNWLTRALRWVFHVSLGLAGLGALDWISWWVLEEIQSGNQWLWGGASAWGVWSSWCCAP